MRRRFELAGPPRQFWEVVRHRGGIVEMTWGTEGRPPQTHRRQLGLAAAKAYIEEQVAARLARGFVEVGLATRVLPPETGVVRLDREAACIAVSLEAGTAGLHCYEGRLVDGEPVFETTRGVSLEDETPLAAAFEDEVARFLALGYAPGGAFALLAAALRPGGRGCVARLAVPTRTLVIYLHGARVVQLSHTEAGPLLEERTCDDVVSAVAHFVGRVVGAEFNGYARVSLQERPDLADDPDLVARCLAEDSAEAWGVYADWLIGRGDPRGEIAQLRIAGHDAEAEALLAAHAYELSDVAEPIPLSYRHGFARGATIDTYITPDYRNLDWLARRTTTVLAAPIARFVDELHFGLAVHTDNDWAPALRAAIASGRVLRSLRFADVGPAFVPLAETAIGDLAFAWPQLPALELLLIRGARTELGELRLPRLATFVRESAGLSVAEVEAIGRALGRGWLPALRSLTLSFGTPRDGCDATAEHLVRIFESAQLVHLGLVACPFVEEAIVGLAHSRVLPRLATLDLSGGAMATRALLQHAEAFGHLERLVLPEITPDVAAALPNAVASQRG